MAMRWRTLFLLLAVCASLGGLTGCSTTDELSARPWNAPRNWETGLPSQMMDGR
jgi:hypothetical protein